MLAVRKRRMAATHPFLRGGFRPFFLGAGLWGVIAIVLWLCVLSAEISIPARFDPVAWHRHEMLFGFVGAAVCGFLLTAIPNWTGRLPIAGKPLLALFGLWASARVAVLFSSNLSMIPAAALDVGTFMSLFVLAGREVLASKNRNLPVVAMVSLFGMFDAADYLESAGWILSGIGWRGAIALITIMISMIGGRIIPSFTRNWMVKQQMSEGLPVQPQSLDLLVILSTSIALIFWLTFPDDRGSGLLLILAGLAQILRFARWRGYRTWADPLVLILHVGYAWVPTGLILLGLSIGGFDLPESAGVHALTAGAMTTMILAVMTRASLGHTGRELKASPITVASYACITFGALVRVSASLGVGRYDILLNVAGAFWGLAMLLFLIVYQPILWKPRLGERA